MLRLRQVRWLVAIDYSGTEPPRFSKEHGGGLGWQLLRVSRTFYQEAAPLIYEKEGFYLANDYDHTPGHLSSFEQYHTCHPIPFGFHFIRKLAFQPTSEISVEFVRAIEKYFPSLHTLKAFRLYTLPLMLENCMWIECHRIVLQAAIAVTSNHSTLKYARLCASFDPDEVINITVELTTDNVLPLNEVCHMLLAPFYTMEAEFLQGGLLHLERISKLPLHNAKAWNEGFIHGEVRIEDILVAPLSLAGLTWIAWHNQLKA